MAAGYCWNRMICTLLLMAVFECYGLGKAIQSMSAPRRVRSSPRDNNSAPQENQLNTQYDARYLGAKASELCMNHNILIRPSCRSTMLSLFQSYGYNETSTIMLCVGHSEGVTVEEVVNIVVFYHHYWPADSLWIFRDVLAEARYDGIQGIWKVLNFADFSYWNKLLGDPKFEKTFNTYKEVLYIANCPNYKTDILTYLKIWTEKRNERDEKGNCIFGCKFENVEMIIWFTRERTEKTEAVFRKIYETVCYIKTGWNWPQHKWYLYDSLNSSEMVKAPLEVVTSILGMENMIITLEVINEDKCKQNGWTILLLTTEVLKCHTEYQMANNECYEGVLDAVYFACRIIYPPLFRNILVATKNKSYQIQTMLKVIAAISDSFFKLFYLTAYYNGQVVELHFIVYDYYNNAVTTTGKKRIRDIQAVFRAAYYGKWSLANISAFYVELNASKFPVNRIRAFFDIFYENDRSMEYGQVMNVLKLSKAIEHTLPLETIWKNRLFFRMQELSALLDLKLGSKGLRYYFNQTNVVPCHADILARLFQYDNLVAEGKLTKENYENLLTLSCKEIMIPENDFNRWVYDSAIRERWTLPTLVNRLETREGHLGFW